MPNVVLKLFALLGEALSFESPPELWIPKPGLVLSLSYPLQWGFPGGSVVENLPTSAGDTGLIPGWRRSPGEGNGNLLQYSCLANPMDRGAWQATVHGVTESWTRLSE